METTHWIEWDCIRQGWIGFMGEWSLVRRKGHWIGLWTGVTQLQTSTSEHGLMYLKFNHTTTYYFYYILLHTTLSHALERSHTRANTDTYNTQGHTSLIATSGLKDISLPLKLKPFWGFWISFLPLLGVASWSMFELAGQIRQKM